MNHGATMRSVERKIGCSGNCGATAKMVVDVVAGKISLPDGWMRLEWTSHRTGEPCAETNSAVYCPTCDAPRMRPCGGLVRVTFVDGTVEEHESVPSPAYEAGEELH